MNSIEKTIVMRMLFGLMAVALTVGGIALVTVLNTDASYPVPLEPNAEAATEEEDVPLEVSQMPEDAYMPVRLTFAGSCTAGSMLGSDSYGTFNEVLAAEGAAYFLEPLNALFRADDLTLAGCDVVLSDGDHTAADRGVTEWYRAPASAAQIFTEGGIDAVSLHTFHTWDYGEGGYNDTVAAAEAAGLLWGDHGRAIYSEQNGVSVAVYCRYADDETDAEAVRAWIETAAAANDFVAVYITTPGTGAFLPDESRQTMFRSFAEAGADLVAGTDTERIQPCETWGDSMIAYSLGALLDGKTKYPDLYTLVLGAELQVIDGELRNVEYKLTPCRAYDDDHPWRPAPLTAPDESAAVMAFLEGSRETPYMD